MPLNVTVYCSSSTEIHPSHLALAYSLGEALALAGHTLVYGGNQTGSMHEVARGARSVGGRVVGVTPRLFVDRGYHDTDAHELVITETMAERKTLLAHRADAFIALPGGLGTYEELFEQLVNRQLHYHHKPIIAINHLGYFNPLIAMLEHGIAERFIKPQARNLLLIATSVQQALALLAAPPTGSAPIAALSHEAAGGH